MPIPAGRTPVEENLFISLHPCACGTAELPITTSTMFEYEDALATRREGSCPGCGQLRMFAFGVRDWQMSPDLLWSFGGDEPSLLVDPGEWLAYAMTWARAGSWDYAARAVDEVAKFIAPGADVPDDEAFASTAAQEVRTAMPGAFRRAALADRARRYRAGTPVGDEAAMPALRRDQPDGLARNALIETLMNRFRRYSETGDAAYVLGHDVLLEISAVLSPNSGQDLIGTALAAQIHWARYGGVPAGRGRADLAVALRHFDALRSTILASDMPPPPPRPVALLLEQIDVRQA